MYNYFNFEEVYDRSKLCDQEMIGGLGMEDEYHSLTWL